MRILGPVVIGLVLLAASCDPGRTDGAPEAPSNPSGWCPGDLVGPMPSLDLGSALPAIAEGDLGSPGSSAFPDQFVRCRPWQDEDHDSATRELDDNEYERHDVSFFWRAPRSGRFLFDLSGSGFVGRVWVADPCRPADSACETPPYELSEGQLVRIIVEEDDPGTMSYRSRAFRLTVFAPTATEHGACYDLVDNDEDLLRDCEDPDCSEDEYCAGIACAGADLGAAVPAEWSGDTTGLPDRYRHWCGVVSAPPLGQDDGAVAGAYAPDAAAVWRAPSSGRFHFSLESQIEWATIALRDSSCAGQELACVRRDEYGERGSEGVHADLTEGQRVVVIVDGGVPAWGRGPFTLRIDRSPPAPIP